jgi:hypothetical protein
VKADQSGFGNSGSASKTGAAILYADVMHGFDTSRDPDNVAANAPYSGRIRFDGVSRAGSMTRLWARFWMDGVDGV